MNELVMGLVLVFTISLAVALGVVSGYLIIAGILNAFARKPTDAKPNAPTFVHAITGN